MCFTDTPEKPQAKRARVNHHTHAVDLLAFMERKQSMEAELRRSEIAIRREELQLQRERLELEKQEMEQRMRIEEQQANRMKAMDMKMLNLLDMLMHKRD